MANLIIAKEGTPLLPTDQHDEQTNNNSQQQGKATVWETTLNLMKTCMGTGTLALPFAAQQGGLLLHTIGLLGIAGWNLYSVNRLCQSLQYLKANRAGDSGAAAAELAPPSGTSTFGKVAWFAFGHHGVHGLDLALVLLFFGIIMAYEDAVLGFLQDTPFNTGILAVDAMVIALVVGSLSLVPDMSYLSKASAFGLSVLVCTFTAIAFYAPPIDASHVSRLSWWPQDGLSGVSHWFGCVVFGFGVVPLTYNYYESMASPQYLRQATAAALLGVAVCYILIGVGLLWLYFPVEGDILQQMPTNGEIVPLIVRFSMIVVVILTCPLLVLPCGLILEGKLFSSPTSKLVQAGVRYGICVTCAFISVGVPGFVYVLSFVGCFSVALVGFVIPPLLHMMLVLQYHNDGSRRLDLLMDGIMLAWGLFATVVSSIYTFRQLYSSSVS